MDYPTHVIIKSAKVVPMMVMGFFILKVRLVPTASFLGSLSPPFQSLNLFFFLV